MPALLYRSVQPPGAVQAACLAPADAAAAAARAGAHDQLQQQLLVLASTQLSACAASADGLQQAATWRSRRAGLALVPLPSGHVLLLADGGHASLHSLQPDAAAGGADEVAHKRLQPSGDECGAGQVQLFGPCVSGALAAAVGSSVASLVAAAYEPGVLHLLKAAPAAAGSMSLQAKAVPYRQAALACCFPDVPSQSALSAVRVHSRVLALAWLSPSEQRLDLAGRSLLAVLHEMSIGGQPAIINLDVLALDWPDASAAPGPWSLRNVHPTSRLLQHFPGSQQLPPGLLLISSRSLSLCATRDGRLPAAAAAASSSSSSEGMPGSVLVQRQVLLEWQLLGLPLSCAAVPGGRYVVGTDQAVLYLVGPAAGGWQQLALTSPLCIPDVLAFVPLQSAAAAAVAAEADSDGGVAMQQQQQQQQQQHQGAAGQQLDGLLFVGSKTSSSQVLGVPQARPADQPPPQQQQQGVWPVLQSAFMPSLAGPQAVCAMQDERSGLPEQQLVVACGTAPRGKLALVRSGCGITPFMLDGPPVPGDAVLFPIVEHGPCQHQQTPQQQQPRQPQSHSLLGFSFLSAGISELMSLGGPTFRQVALPGLQQGEPSLLMAGLPGGWLLQVTAAGVWVLGSQAGGQLQTHWAPPGLPISLAAAAGGQVVLACGAAITCCSISCCDGSICTLASRKLQQQASALGLLTLSDDTLVVAAGLWVDNSIVLMPWPGTSEGSSQQQQQQLCVRCVQELGQEQPRSVALLPVGDADVLLVGTNSGSVLLWQLVRAQQAGSSDSGGAWALLHGRELRLGVTDISMQPAWLPGGGDASAGGQAAVQCVYAHAGGAGAFIRPCQALATCRAQQQQQQRQQQQRQQQQREQAAGQAGGGAGSAPLHAVDCVQVSRLCGSEGCVAATVIHAPDMPNSLAWVSTQHRLCFGGLDVHHKLRWRSRPLPGTPLAMAQHRPTNTLVLLVQADARWGGDAGEQCVLEQVQPHLLLVLDASSLCVLMSLSLVAGHTYTSLAVLDLPCTSMQQQQQPGGAAAGAGAGAGAGGAAAAAAPGSSGGTRGNSSSSNSSSGGTKPFIVLGSTVSIDLARQDASGRAGTGQRGAEGRETWRHHRVPGLMGPAGAYVDSDAAAEHGITVAEIAMLSVFELSMQLQSQPAAAAAAAGEVSGAASGAAAAAPAASGSSDALVVYDLVCHGMSPLPCGTAASLCTVVPQPMLQQQGDGQAGSEEASGGREGSRQRSSAAAGSSAAGAQEGAATAAASSGSTSAQQPLLAVGCDSGVALYSVLVDDAGLQEEQQLQEQLARIAQVVDEGHVAAALAAQQPQLPQHAAPADGAEQPPEPPQRMRMEQVASSPVLAGGVVWQLRSCGGGLLLAMEALGSLSVLQALALPRGGTQLLVVGSDQSGHMALDAAVLGDAAAQQAPHAAGGGADAAAPGTGATHVGVLVAMHPEGLLLLLRDTEAEVQHQQAAQQVAMQAWEAGMAGPGADGLARGQPWVGGGEAAPWADRGALDDPDHVWRHAEVGGGLALDRAGLAAVATAAARRAGAGTGPGDGVGVAAVAPQLAPRMGVAAACAPSPGSCLLCPAHLGLHLRPQQRRQQQRQQQAQDSSEQASSGSIPVWCLSPSGAVGVALQVQAPTALCVLQHQLWPAQAQQRGVLVRADGAAAGPPHSLRRLDELDRTASFRTFQRHLSEEARAEIEDELVYGQGLGYSSIDADMLLAAAPQRVPSDAGVRLHRLLSEVM